MPTETAYESTLQQDRSGMAKLDQGALVDAINRIEAEVAEAEAEIESLLAVLNPITQNVETARPQSVGEEPQPPKSPMTRRILDVADRIARMRDELRGRRTYLDLR